jgi:hypothetical protein
MLDQSIPPPFFWGRILIEFDWIMIMICFGEKFYIGIVRFVGRKEADVLGAEKFVFPIMYKGIHG